MRVDLLYFRPTGSFLQRAEYESRHVGLVDIWEEVAVMRRLGRLPGLREKSGRDLYIVVLSEPPFLIRPPFVDEDDVTPMRVPTGEHAPLERPASEPESSGVEGITLPLVKGPRTGEWEPLRKPHVPPREDDK